jgi:crotonobetainyl-CoA:carnitine CoA-transferase CaiB-like acyl-CoA transferase
MSNAIVMALLERERTGMGQKIEVNLLNAQVAALSSLAPGYFATGREPQRVGSGHADLVPYQAFSTTDGYVIVGCLNEKFWQYLCKCLGKENLMVDERFRINIDRVKHREELLEILDPIFKEKSTAQWVEILDQKGIPCSPVNTVGQALANPQLSINNMLVDLEHPLAGKIRILGLPFKLCRTPGEITAPAPLQGQHTIEILKEIGYEAAAIDKLLQDQVVAGPSTALG